MNPKEFRIVRSALGLTQGDVAQAMEVNPRSARRWEDVANTHPSPEAVSSWLDSKWSMFADRVADALDAAEELESIEQPITLITYASEVECITRTGLSLAEHDALVGHIAMAYTCADIDYRIIYSN